MKHIGRKVYNNWGPNLTVGIGLLTSEWSSFKVPPDRSDVKIFYLSEFSGEITQTGEGFTPSDSPFGKSVTEHLEYAHLWYEHAPKLPPGFCGMRMISTWSDATMLVIDKIVGDPVSRFDIHPEAYMSAMAYDVFEFDGELIERKAGRPAAQLFGLDPNRIITQGPWFSTEQERDYIASKKLGGPKAPGF
ncbi:hypothetical protein HFN89_00990 [Rhizobium laguerreae]|nr:hypothetical protein [Rhizobium laguerreae]